MNALIIEWFFRENVKVIIHARNFHSSYVTQLIMTSGLGLTVYVLVEWVVTASPTRSAGLTPKVEFSSTDGLQWVPEVVCRRMRVCVCMYACVRVCVHVCPRACVRVCVHVCVRVCMRACVRACVYACARVPACVHLGVVRPHTLH